MVRGKKVTAEMLALRIAEMKAKKQARINAVAAAEDAAIAELEARVKLRQEAEQAKPILRPKEPTMARKISQTEEDMLIEVARQSLRQYGTVLPPKEVLYATMDATCPRCGKTGKIATEFGFKRYKGTRKGAQEEIRPQSWCRDCRNSPASHPTRNKKR